MSGLSAVVGARGGTLQSDCAVRVHSCRAGEHPTSGRRVVSRHPGADQTGRGALQTGPDGPPVPMYREPHVASRVSGHHASPRGDAARDIQNATRPIYNKARGRRGDGTPTCAFSFPHMFPHKRQATYHTHLLVPPSGRRPKRRKPTHSAHQPRLAPTHSTPPHPGTPSAPSNWFRLVRGSRSTPSRYSTEAISYGDNSGACNFQFAKTSFDSTPLF